LVKTFLLLGAPARGWQAQRGSPTVVVVLSHFVIPVLARHSASARRRENGNPDVVPRIKYGAGLLEFIPAKAGAGMTEKMV